MWSDFQGVEDNMASGEFDKVFTKGRPHILEKICLYLDYNTFKDCLEVNKAWKTILTAPTFQKKAKSVFREEIVKDEEKLWIATVEGNTEEVNKLLSVGMVEVDCGLMPTMPPIMCAAILDNKVIFEMLLNGGANPGNNPLHYAAQNGSKHVAKYLLETGAQPNEADKCGWTPLHLAARYGRKEVVELLLDNGAETSKAQLETEFFPPIMYEAWTALHAASYEGHKSVVQLLLLRGADPNVAGRTGRTPLLEAANVGHQDVLQLLLDRGAKPNDPDEMGWTPLHGAARNGHKEAVQLLLDRGADPNKRDGVGETPISWAKATGHNDVVQLLYNTRAEASTNRSSALR